MIIDGQDANLGWRCHFDLLANQWFVRSRFRQAHIPIGDRLSVTQMQCELVLTIRLPSLLRLDLAT
jgi:hypothetical protein